MTTTGERAPEAGQDVMSQIVQFVNDGWSVQFWPNEPRESGGITLQKPGEVTLWIDDPEWQDDIRGAWRKLVLRARAARSTQ